MSNLKILWVFLGATALTIIGCALFLIFAGVSDDNIRLLLRLTARIAFLVLLVVFVARPSQQLFRTPLTHFLVLNRPLLGAAFAGVHTAHFSVLLYRAQQISEFEFSASGNLLGMLTYLIIYAMLITTFSGPRRLIGPTACRILHKVGLYWVTAVFAQTQLPQSWSDLSDLNWWLEALLLVVLVIRLTAFFAQKSRG
jgi:hypothetical protein